MYLQVLLEAVHHFQQCLTYGDVVVEAYFTLADGGYITQHHTTAIAHPARGDSDGPIATFIYRVTLVMFLVE